MVLPFFLTQAVFNFCGCLHFQLQLSPRLRKHLTAITQGGGNQPVIFDQRHDRMARMSDYKKSPKADNIKIFQGREIRQVPTAAGGMGCILQLSLANVDDPEGWTRAEVEDYNGWAHDSKRPWRDAWTLECDGFAGFDTKFSDDAIALHHRFYLHFDSRSQLWLSAEDGCEGELVAVP